jgi:uncharacterized protein YbjQ (UPF0145 family)
MIFGGSKKYKSAADDELRDQQNDQARDSYLSGKFKIVTTDSIDGRDVKLVFGLVVARGYNFDTAFYGLIARAMDAGAEAVLGYRENVAFHPEGDRFYSCYGTAVMLQPKK